MFGFAHHGVVTLGHDIVIVLNDQIGLRAILKDKVQVLAHTLDPHIFRGGIFFLAHLLQLVLGTGLGFDAHGLPTITLTLGNLNNFVVFDFSSINNNFVIFRHIDSSALCSEKSDSW